MVKRIICNERCYDTSHPALPTYDVEKECNPEIIVLFDVGCQTMWFRMDDSVLGKYFI